MKLVNIFLPMLFIFCVILGSIICADLFWYDPKVITLFDALFKWQDLLGAIVSLIGVCFIAYQIYIETNRYAEIKKSKEFSVRCYMSAALSEIHFFCKEVLLRKLAINDTSPIKYPTDAITLFKSSIEHIDAASASKIFDMVNWYQKHNARLEEFSRKYDHITQQSEEFDHFENQAIYTINLAEKVLNIFPYARGKVDQIPDLPRTKMGKFKVYNQLLGLGYQNDNPDMDRRFKQAIEKYWDKE